MFFYQYFCESNDRTVEVAHPRSTRLRTWGEVCRYVGLDPGRTPEDAPVARLISGMPFVQKLKGLDKDAPSGGKLLV